MGGNGPGLLGARNHQPRCQGARHWSSVSPSAPEPRINKDWEAGRRPRRPGQLEEDLVQFQASFVPLTQDVLQFGDHGQVLAEAPLPPVSGGLGITFSPRTHFAGLLPLPPPSQTPRRQMREHHLLLIFSFFVLPLFTRHVHTVLRAHRWAEDQSPLCCPSQPPFPPRTWAEAPAPGALLLGVKGGLKMSPPTSCVKQRAGEGARREWGERFLLLPNSRHKQVCPPTWLQLGPKTTRNWETTNPLSFLSCPGEERWTAF